MEEKQTLDEKNMVVIEKAYHHPKDGKSIQKRLQKIKAHPWVKLIEGKA